MNDWLNVYQFCYWNYNIFQDIEVKKKTAKFIHTTI